LTGDFFGINHNEHVSGTIQDRCCGRSGCRIEIEVARRKDPRFTKNATKKDFGEIEKKILRHYDGVLSDEEKETLRLCRELRNKVLHTDFRAARDKLNELGVETLPGGVRKIDIPDPSFAKVYKKIRDAKAGTEGVLVADSSSTDLGGVFGWFLEAGRACDFQKASEAFKKAATIIDRLAEIE
jgi:hypothetical protein